ncbi:hypothetical protein HOD75_02385 [archaeon]|jgi:hypothetical protein|nr:hypothetical protein [archaeon]MBT4241726.1 hypothetical protein [archaeon]MBT4418274.1 hypothetical protein [archaeon]
MDVDEVLKKYSKKIEKEVQGESNLGQGSKGMTTAGTGFSVTGENISQDYSRFKQDMLPELSRYERLVKSLGSFIKIKLAKKDSDKINKSLQTAHLNVSAGEVAGLAIFSFLAIVLIGILISVAIWLIWGGFPILFLGLIFIFSMFLFYYFYSTPSRLAIKWKLKASSQMVPAVLYTVIYMKHTSNLERAISFVSKHVEAPLSLDLRKVLWDVETGKFSSLKDSLDSYLDFWRDTNMEFVESFHLIESSLYEPDESRRVQILERSLKVILDGVYDKMLRYTHSVKAPLTNIYMLGIVLPTLGLALLPLASTLLQGLIKSSHVFILFNLIIPFFVFYLTTQVMLKRPGGYGESSLLEKNPLYPQYTSKRPYVIAGLICFPLLILGLLPLIFGLTFIPDLIGLQSDYPLTNFGLGFLGDGGFFDFKTNDEGNLVGPFGIGALLLSLFIPLSISMFFSISFSMRTKNLIKARNDTKDLEKEFNSSLFTLGNRLGDGNPAEIAFSKVAESVKGQKTENFFRIVHTNIQSMGMSLEEAIFNPRRGALIYYPSNLIATSMRILIESVKKGLKVAAQSLMSISEYVRNLQKINERLRDLLADVVSDMSSNMTFLAPLLAGIVVGLASMITAILGKLSGLITGGTDIEVLGGDISTITTLFDQLKMVPPYYLQIAIGIYLIQIVFVLTGTLVTIDAGEDKLMQTYKTAKNLLRSSILYLIVALVSIVVLGVLANIALPALG